MSLHLFSDQSRKKKIQCIFEERKKLGIILFSFFQQRLTSTVYARVKIESGLEYSAKNL